MLFNQVLNFNSQEGRGINDCTGVLERVKIPFFS